MKKEKVALIRKYVDQEGKRILDLGCAQGVVSCMIRAEGGTFWHADLDFSNLLTARQLLGNRLFQIQEEQDLPLSDEAFDLVFALDILEHVEDDQGLLREIHRVLKPGGQVVISTPIDGRGFVLNSLKKIAGLKPEIYGHRRPGYSLPQLETLLGKRHFSVIRAGTYSKFFTEFFEVLLNIFYTRKHRISHSELRSGSITPTSDRDLEKNRFLFRVYSLLVYPLVYLITRLDKLLFFKTGYATFVIAGKNQ
jgi:SAM-dependent methyltransferase